MEELRYIKTYGEYKAQLDAELQRTAEGFVRIGYLLRVAQDTNILAESGYANVNDFAMAEYGLDKSQVSRFMRINERFSEGGYSDRLQERFQGYGNAKLGIMLTLPEAVTEELTPDFSKAEILELKEAYDEENRITDLEVLLEEREALTPEGENSLFRILWYLGQAEPERYVQLFEAVRESMQAMYEALVPNEEAIYTVRIPGEGRYMLSAKGADQPVTVLNMRRPEEKEAYSWEKVLSCVERLAAGETAEASWEALYGEAFPEKAEVAPVQQKSEAGRGQEKKPAPRKEKKIHRVEVPKKRTEPEKEPEEQLPGQDSILEHPEWMPDTVETGQEDAEDSTAAGGQESFTAAGETGTEAERNGTESGEIGTDTDENGTEAGTEDAAGAQQGTAGEEAGREPDTGAESGEAAAGDDGGADGTGILDNNPDSHETADTEEIWERAAISVAKLNLFFQNWTAGNLTAGEIPKESLQTAYHCAVGAAAELERMLNHG